MTQKICPVCESKFDFEDPNYKFCPYCGIVLIRTFPHGKKPIYNPSKRNASIMDKKMRELKPPPWGDEENLVPPQKTKEILEDCLKMLEEMETKNILEALEAKKIKKRKKRGN